MKKIIYIKPEVGRKCMDPSSLLTVSINNVNDQEAGQGSEGSPVNYGNQNDSFWDDEK